MSADRLAELLVLAQPFPLEIDAASDLAMQWVSVSALAQEASQADLRTDPEAVAESMWLERREWILDQDREARLGEAVRLTPEAIEAAFGSDSLRLVAHVLRRVGPETPAQERLLQQRTAERILADLVSGGGWDQAVAQSEDLATRGAAGLLGLFGPGELRPQALSRAAFRLAPGEASAVVQSPRGFHIVYRPRLEDARGLFRLRLHQRRLLQADAEANRALAEARALTVADDATGRLMEIGGAPQAFLDDQHVLAHWSGGELMASVVARYVAALPEDGLDELLAAGDEGQRRFLADLAAREIRISEFPVDDPALVEALDSLVTRGHRAEMDYWLTALSEDGASPPSEAGVSTYTDALVARRQDPSVISPVLEAWLLSRVEHGVHPAGIQAAVAAARTMIQGAGATP